MELLETSVATTREPRIRPSRMITRNYLRVLGHPLVSLVPPIAPATMPSDTDTQITVFDGVRDDLAAKPEIQCGEQSPAELAENEVSDAVLAAVESEMVASTSGALGQLTDQPLVDILIEAIVVGVEPIAPAPAKEAAPSHVSTYLPSGSASVVDGLRNYLREAGQTALLKAEEEVQLSQQIEAGLEARARLKASTVPAAETRGLLLEVDLGEAARQRLISANLRLVVSVAKQHLGPDADFGDLIQEGNLGLMRAVDRFDWRKGNRFSTYALWWIRQAISSAVGEQSRSIRLPSHVIDSLTRMNRTEQRLAQELGRHPEDEEVSQALGITAGRLSDLRLAMERPSSLHTPIGEDGDSELADMVEDRSAQTPVSAVMASSLRDQVDLALATLDPREQLVLSMRFGLDDDQTRTLEEVGRELRITKERVRQLEARAIRKLRGSSRCRCLMEYAD